MRRLAILLVISAVTFGCGGNSAPAPTSNNSGGGIVHAAGFTNAAFVGSYAYQVAGGNYTDIGVVVADGNGNITSGKTFVASGSAVCSGTFTGVYNVNADGTGTLTTTVQSSSCGPSGGGSTFTLILAQGGASAIFAASDGVLPRSGVAIKQ